MIYTRLLLTVLILAMATVPVRAGISLDHVTNLQSAGTIHCGGPVQFHFRWNGSPELGPSEFVTGSSNGIRLYDNGSFTIWSYPLGDTIMGEWNPDIDWSPYFDGGVFINVFSNDGAGADTVGFGSFRLFSDGIPGTFNDIFAIINIAVDCSETGKQICLDSSYYPPGGTWLWSTTIGTILNTEWDGPHCFTVGSFGTSTPGEDRSLQLPREFSLNQNYPNPFNPATTISFDVPFRSHVKISVYNTLGQLVAVPLDRPMEPGFNSTVLWDAAHENVASGVYFFKMEAGDFVRTRKMLLLK